MTEFIHINTENTSLIIRAEEGRRAELLHYGARLRETLDYSSLTEAHAVPYGDMVAAERGDPNFGLEDAALEFSTLGRGDFREPIAEFTLADGSTTTDFLFASYEKRQGKPEILGLPSSIPERDDESIETHIITLRDGTAELEARLYYTAFYSSNVIARSVEYVNTGASPVVLGRAMSMEMDIMARGWDFISFTGAWAAERTFTRHTLANGIYVNDSKLGVSSARANPFVMLASPNANEEHGEVYAVNLVYSGSHAEIAEQAFSGRARLLAGINPSGFSWTLAPNESFHTPEAVTTYSKAGFGTASRNMHRFVRDNIIRGEWQYKERPVLVNNWEGTGMDFDEKKLLSIAREGADVGAELFVMDDGWFGARDDDTKGLGDWTLNPKKLPHGLVGLAEKLKAMGLMFGIWVEPEMVNEDSDLFRAHPEWAVGIPGRESALGRNQRVLDLTNPAVRTYLINTMSRVFSQADIAYVKWDCNRHFSDMFTPTLEASRQGEFCHRYVLGLYEILQALTSRFPHILFEGCASGGNRFDLGMLAYMPQTWTSDNTDPLCRMDIQEGTSYGYPLSTIGAHVSASPSMSALRRTGVETRFNVAAFGLLGYEMDMTELTSFDKKAIKAQISYYKAHRRLFQFGELYRSALACPGGKRVWEVVSSDKCEAIAMLFQRDATPSLGRDTLRLSGLDAALDYTIEGRTQYIPVASFGSLVKHALPLKLKGDGAALAVLSSHYMFKLCDESYSAGGDMLMEHGVCLKEQFAGTGYNDGVRLLGDCGSRLYYIRAKDAALVATPDKEMRS